VTVTFAMLTYTHQLCTLLIFIPLKEPYYNLVRKDIKVYLPYLSVAKGPCLISGTFVSFQILQVGDEGIIRGGSLGEILLLEGLLATSMSVGRVRVR